MLELTPLELEALSLSLTVAFWSVTASLPFGLLVAWLLARCSFPGKTLLNALVHLPLVLPPVVVGYILLEIFSPVRWLGSFIDQDLGWPIAFSWRGAALAAAVMAFPLMVRAMRLSLESVDRKLEAAARTLGASRLDVFTSITLPLMAPGILTGIILAFARSLGEFGATITFVSNIPGETRTLPLALYTLVQTPGGEGGALRLTLISIAVSLVALALSEILARRVSRRLEG